MAVYATTKSLLDLGVDEETAKAMTAKYRERYSERGLDECSVYPGVVELVKYLRGLGARVAVATGKPTPFTVDILERHGLGGVRLGREGAVMIGDRDNDVIAARHCNIPCVGVSWGYAEPGELVSAGAVVVVDDTEELKNFLLR